MRLKRNQLGLVIAGIVWGSGFATVGAGAASDDLKAVFKARYDAMKAAMAAHDGSAIAAILAPNFTSVDVGGKQIDGAQMIREVNNLGPDPNKISNTELVSAAPEKDYVVVEQRYDMKTVRPDAEGTPHNVELIAVSTDKWVKPKTEWLLEQTVTNEMSYFLDGKQIFHKVNNSNSHP